MKAFPADFRKRFVACYSSAIQRPRGIAQPQGDDRGLPRARAQNPVSILWRHHCRSAQRDFAIFLFDRFQIALLPDWNTIILTGKVGIIPVGVRLFL